MTSISATRSPLTHSGHSAGTLASDPGIRQVSETNEVQDFDEIFVRHREMVYRVCLRWLGHHHDAEDVTQETFRRAARAIKSWNTRRPIEPWLVTIAGNRCRSFLARRGRERLTTSFDNFAADCSTDSTKVLAAPSRVDSMHAIPEQELINEEWLDLALNRLPNDQRRAFELIHRDEFSYPQAAEEMGRSVGTIKTWVHRARKTMQDLFRLESLRHAAAVSVASVVLVFGWLMTRSSEVTPATGAARLADVEIPLVLPSVESSRGATELSVAAVSVTDWQLASLQAFTEADLRFDRVLEIPQGTSPVADWIEQSSPVLEQFQQGVAPMRRTIQDVMMLFTCRSDQGAAGAVEAELSEMTSSSPRLLDSPRLLERQGSLEIS